MKSEFHELVLPKMATWSRQGHRVALLTLVGVKGSSPRPLGAQMIVSDQGCNAGQITGGCLEHALVSEAELCLENNKSKVIRFSEQNPYFDLSPPCGGELEILIDVDFKFSQLSDILGFLSEKSCCVLTYDLANAMLSSCISPSSFSKKTERDFSKFHKVYKPDLFVCVIGKGPILYDLVRLGQSFEFQFRVFSPDRHLLEDLEALAEVEFLPYPEIFTLPCYDYPTGYVVVFHDHQRWEPAIFSQIFKQKQRFYTGALGSQRTHRVREESLRQQGFCEQDLSSIKAPIGFDLNAKNPREIALAIVAELVLAKNLWAKGAVS